MITIVPCIGRESNLGLPRGSREYMAGVPTALSPLCLSSSVQVTRQTIFPNNSYTELKLLGSLWNTWWRMGGVGREGVGGSDRKMEYQVWCGVVSSCTAVRNNTANGGILALFFQCVCVCVCGALRKLLTGWRRTLKSLNRSRLGLF